MKLPVDPKVKDEALATYVFEQMIDEGKSLRQICKEIGAKPSAISLWLREDFRDKYQDAQEERAERLADDLMEETNIELKDGFNNRNRRPVMSASSAA